MGVGKIVFTEEQIQNRIAEIAEEINKDYQGRELIIVSVLKGSLYFVADLTRRLTMPLSIDFLSIGVSPGVENKPRVVRIKKDLDLNLGERHVLLVEDLIGTGLTLAYVCQRLEMDKPASLKICTLLDKSKDRLLPIKIDYRCFVMPDRFLVGYGLDYNEQYRNLPYIAEFRKK
ncbi:MAG: hypoxanthine phosphoribosyltransferase [Syntrophomonadaceae bacterium]